MNKPAKHLIQSALASALFLSPTVYADIVISTPYNVPPSAPLVTSVQGNVTITATGQVNVTLANTDGILIDNLNRTIINSGSISATRNGIQIQNDFNQITNNSGGMITPGSSGATAGILANVASALTGDIDNYGKIFSAAGGFNFGVFISTPEFEGVFTNHATGLIENSLGTAGVFMGLGFNHFDNQGIIRTTPATTSGVLSVGVIDGEFINSGTIEALGAGSAAFVMEEPQNHTLNNSGSIYALNPDAAGTAVIFVSNPSALNITGQIINSGNITNDSAGKAIDLQSYSNIFITVTQNAGIITGDVLLASGGGTVLTLQGGVIDGDVIAGNMSNVLQLNGGTITGTTSLGNSGDTVNLIGAHLQALNGSVANDTINISPLGTNNTFNPTTAPSFTSLDGGAGDDVLNINGTFVANGTITNIETINIKNSGTVFTNNQAITNLNTLLDIFSLAKMIANASVTGFGALQIDGTLQINRNQTVMMANNTFNNDNLTILGEGLLQTSAYFQNDAAYSVELNSPTVFGQIQTSDNATLSGSINPFLGLGPFIPAGTVFPVIQAMGVIADNATLVQPSTPFVFFTKSVDNCGANNCLDLTLHLRSLASIVSTPVSEAVGASLDSLLLLFPDLSPEFLSLFAQLERLNSAELTAALESLAPSTNYAIVKSSQLSMDNAFDNIQVRLEDLRRVRSRVPREELILVEGANFGDLDNIFGGRGYSASWGKIYGVDISQQERQNVPGFSVDAVGVAIGNDWEVTPCSAFGLAFSYTKANATDKSVLGNKVDTQGLQGTLYGWVEPWLNVYIDSMLGASLIQYDTTRNITVGNLSGQSNAIFHGAQYGAQMDLGYVLTPSDNVYLVPLLRLKYTYLAIDDYSESGSGLIGLDVENNDINEAILGAGFRWAARFDFPYGVYVPELFAMIAYDFAGQPLGMTSEFIGGGIPFVIDSITPAQTLYLIGLSVNAHPSHHYTISLKYNLELRDQFVGNSGYVEWHYSFD